MRQVFLLLCLISAMGMLIDDAFAVPGIHISAHEYPQPPDRIKSYENAVERYESALREEGLTDDQLGHFAYRAGNHAYAVWSFEEAKAYFDSSIAYFESAHGERSEALLKPQSGLVHANIQRWRRNEIRSSSKKLEKIVTANFSYPSPERYDYFVLRAQSAFSLREHQWAKNYLQKAIEDAIAIGDEVRTADAYVKLAWIISGKWTNRDKKHPEDSTKHLVAAVALYEKNLPLKHPKRIRAYRKLHTNYIIRGQGDNASKYTQYYNGEWGVDEMKIGHPSYSEPPRFPDSDLRIYPYEWTIVEFTVKKNGEVSNPIIVDSEPKRKNDRRSKHVVQQRKFEPKLVDGMPTERRERILISYVYTSN